MSKNLKIPFTKVTRGEDKGLERLSPVEDTLPLLNGDGQFDLLFIADAVVRHAKFDDQKTAEKLAALALKAGNNLTWLEPNGVNGRAFVIALHSTLKEIAKVARPWGGNVLLPFSLEAVRKDKTSLEMLSAAFKDFPNIKFRDKPYKYDLSAFGDIDPAIEAHNLFYQNGLRGFVDYHPALRFKWDESIDSERGKGGQTSFGFDPS